jgi:hypothetical protein
MYHKTLVRTIVYGLTMLMLALSVTGVAASSGDPEKHGEVFTVSPTGVDDTANIIKAFAVAQAAGPGATVQFTAGTFITDLINVVRFNGFVKGMGQDKTIITPKPGLSCQAEADQGIVPALFRFSEGNIQVSDLTLQLANPDLCAPYNFSWWGTDMTTWLYSGITFAGPVPTHLTTPCSFTKNGKVDAVVDRVSVIVGDLAVVWSAITVGGDFAIINDCINYGYNVETHLKMTNSHIVNPQSIGLDAANVDGGNVVITGNRVQAGGGMAIWIMDIANAPVLVSENDIASPMFAGIFLAQGYYPDVQVPVAPAQFIVRSNTIKLTGFANGILFLDNTAYLGANETPRMKILVEKNQLIQDGPTTVGVFGAGGVQNALVLNNRFTGQGGNAIVAGVWGPDMGWLISGSDMRSLQPYPPATSMDKILLGPMSSNFKVITDNKDNVNDQGTNNIVIGGQRHNGGHVPVFHLPPEFGKHHH